MTPTDAADAWGKCYAESIARPTAARSKIARLSRDADLRPQETDGPMYLFQDGLGNRRRPLCTVA